MNRFLVAAVLVVVAGRALADSPATAFSAGMSAYAKGDYATAIVAFETAFRLDPRPEVAFTLAQTHRNQYFVDRDATHLHRALGLYRHYLAEDPAGRRATHARLHLETIETILRSLAVTAPPHVPQAQPTQLLLTANAADARASIDGGAFAPVPRVVDVVAGRHRVRVEARGYEPVEVVALAVAERLVVVPATLEAQPGLMIVNTDDDADIVIDGRAAAATAKLSPGTHRVAVLARGRHPVVRDVEVAPGGRAVVTVDLVMTPRRRAARWTLYGTAGLAGAALLGTAVALHAQRDAESIPAAPHRSTSDIDHYNAALDRRNTWRAVSIGLATSAGIAAVTGAALWYFDLPRPEERAPAISPVLGPESVGAAVVGRF